MEFDPRLTECEHQDAERLQAAESASAKIIDQWDRTADPRVRERLLNDVGREMMKVHEAPPPELHPKEMRPGELGAYSDDDFRIDANRELLQKDDPTDGLETYLHEYRHAEQAYEVQKSHGPMRPSVNTERAAALEVNQSDYISPTEARVDYERQLLEDDAEAFAKSTGAEILKDRDALRGGDRPNPPAGASGDEVAAWRLSVTERDDT
jgi:hypothetical protein